MNKIPSETPGSAHCCSYHSSKKDLTFVHKVQISFNNLRLSVKALRAVIDLTSPDHPHLGPSSLPMGAGVPFQLSPGLSVTCHNTIIGVPVSSQSPDICWMDALALLCRELSSCKNSQPYAGTLSPALALALAPFLFAPWMHPGPGPLFAMFAIDGPC